MSTASQTSGGAPLPYGAHVRALLALGLPLAGGQLAQMAIQVTDTVMLGWYSAEALAALTIAGAYFFVFFILGSGFGWAVMPLAASAAAEEDAQRIRRVTRMGLWLSALFAVVVWPAFHFSQPVLLMLGQEDQVAADAARYLRIAWWGLMPNLLAIVLRSYLAALERTQTVLWITIAMALINVPVNYALIFGNWGAPQLGIAGAAIASVVVNCLMPVVMILYARRHFPAHALLQRIWRPDGEIMSELFRLGAPIGLTSLAEVALFAASSVMMGWLGTVALAAHGVALQVASLFFMVQLGLANAATVRAGTAFGRRDAQLLARGGRAALGLALAFSALTIVLFLTVPQLLVSGFVDPGDPLRPELLSAGAALLAVAALFQPVDALQVVTLGLLRGVRDTAVPMVMAIASYGAVGLPVAYVLGFPAGLGPQGIWLGLVAGLGCAGALLSWRFWRKAARL